MSYVIVTSLRSVGPGAVNRNKNGDLKSISVGGIIRQMFSPQKEKNAFKEYFKVNLSEVSKQSRAWGLWILMELTNYKVPEEKAKVWAKAIWDNFMGHNLQKEKDKKEAQDKKDAEAKKNGKKPKKEKNPLISETTRLFPEEKVEILKAVEGLVNGTIKDPALVKFYHEGEAIDLMTSGRARPNQIMGGISVGPSFGVNSFAPESDFFVARDDFSREPFYEDDPQSSAHMGTTYLASSIMNGCVIIDIDTCIKNMHGNADKAKENIMKQIEAVCLSGASSSSTNGAQTHTRPGYVLIEKMESAPRSLGVAFEQPVSSMQEAVENLRAFRDGMNKVYKEEVPYKELCCYKAEGKWIINGDIEELKQFAVS